MQLLLDLLQVKGKGLADLSQPIILLGSNLCFHAIFLRTKLHVELRFTFTEVNLLL